MLDLLTLLTWLPAILVLNLSKEMVHLSMVDELTSRVFVVHRIISLLFLVFLFHRTFD